jgi:ubiquinone biosynthesis protein UbiJ
MTNGPQPPLARALTAWLERALNREIAESSAASDLLGELDGDSFAIDVRGLGVRCVLRAGGGRVAVEPSWSVEARPREPAPETRKTPSLGLASHIPVLGRSRERVREAAPPPASVAAATLTATATVAASATLSASPLDLLRLARVSDFATLRGTGATITGSPEVAERFAKLLELARPDLEEHAARWIGDVPAHALGEAARDARAWLERAARTLRADAAEFLQEESRALPAALEARAFYADVDKLRDDVERAAARLARLERR